MITIEGVHAKGKGRPRPMLVGASLTVENGLISIIGAPLDGTSLLLSCLSGQAKIKRGAIAIDGRVAAQGRLDVAYVPLAPVLPESLRVHEVLALASEFRNEPLVSLAPLGLEALGDRRVLLLSIAEARAVALSLALGSNAATLLVEEPLSLMEGARHVAALLRERARRTTIIVTTASVRDAATLGGRLALITKGVISVIGGALRHELRVVSKSAEALAAAIGDDAAVSAVSLPDPTTLAVVGDDLRLVAAAVNRAASNARIAVELIEPVVASLEELRAYVTPAPAVAR